MELKKELVPILSDMEYLIGKECYNPNSYDGWKDIEGRDFRYPVTLRYPARDRNIKTKENINEIIELYENDEELLDALTYMKYRFGSNELFIGQGLLNVLEYLEGRYGFSFVELEQSRSANNK